MRRPAHDIDVLLDQHRRIHDRIRAHMTHDRQARWWHAPAWIATATAGGPALAALAYHLPHWL